MTQYNINHSMKLSNAQLNKLRSTIKSENDVVIRLSPNMIGDSNEKTNFPHELLLTGRQVSSIRKTFSNNSSVDIKFSKTQLSKMNACIKMLEYKKIDISDGTDVDM